MTLGRLTLLVVCVALSSRAQYPPDTQWRKIHTAHYEVIFPREIETDAQRAANMLETLYGPLTDSLGVRVQAHHRAAAQPGRHALRWRVRVAVSAHGYVQYDAFAGLLRHQRLA